MHRGLSGTAKKELKKIGIFVSGDGEFKSLYRALRVWPFFSVDKNSFEPTEEEIEFFRQKIPEAMVKIFPADKKVAEFFGESPNTVFFLKTLYGWTFRRGNWEKKRWHQEKMPLDRLFSEVLLT